MKEREGGWGGGGGWSKGMGEGEGFKNEIMEGISGCKGRGRQTG